MRQVEYTNSLPISFRSQRADRVINGARLVSCSKGLNSTKDSCETWDNSKMVHQMPGQMPVQLILRRTLTALTFQIERIVEAWEKEMHMINLKKS